MIMDPLSLDRREYGRMRLEEKDLPEDPIPLFDLWVRQAMEEAIPDATAMTLSTVDAAGAPSSRVVLLKGNTGSGLRFFSSETSRKGREMKENPRVAAHFYWPTLERQLRIRGVVRELGTQETESYFKSRPRESQLGAWASEQSSEIGSREILDSAYQELSTRFEGGDIPCPPYWKGYEILPESMEFWQGGRHRLHDRIEYLKEDKRWVRRRLAP